MSGPADFGVDFGTDFYGVAWPAAVNQFVQTQSYGETPDTNVAQFQPEVGAPKLRRRMSISSDSFSFDVWMTGAEYAAWLAFYRTNLADGTLQFTRQHPRTLAIGTFIFTGSAPSMKAFGPDNYAVSITMKSVP